MLLVVTLTMIVALTVGLSVVSRTITNLRISRQNEESGRAFQAAEAGIEQSLQSGGGSASLEFSNNSKYTTTASDLSGTSFLLNGGELIDQDVGLDIWLSNYPDYSSPISGNITIYWSTSNQITCDPTGENNVRSALEVNILSGSLSNPSFEKHVLDSCSRISGSDTPGSGATINNVVFDYGATIPVSNGLIMKAVPIYNSTKIAVSSSVSLPTQGTLIESVGESGETVRKVQYFSSHPQIPLEIFPYSIISQ